MALTLCLFTDSLEPSGVGEHMLTLAAEIRQRGRVGFVCPPSPAGRQFLCRARSMGLETLALEVAGDSAAQHQFVQWLRRHEVNLFHGHAGIGWEGHHGIYAAREAEVPCVLRTEHLPDLITDPGQRLDHLRMLQAIDRLICVSEEARASFLAVGVPANKLRVVRNGIRRPPIERDSEGVRTSLGLPSYARIVLTVARFTEQKGHGFLLEALSAVVGREPSTYFVWVGQGPLESELQERVYALGLDARVLFLGRRNDVPRLLDAADLFVLPSRFEGLPLSLLEAMAAGLPVVGTQVCGIREAVGDGATGRLVPVGDAAALATAILEVLEHRTLAARWGQAGREWVAREFSAARMARETTRIYDESLGLPAPASCLPREVPRSHNVPPTTERLLRAEPAVARCS